MAKPFGKIPLLQLNQSFYQAAHTLVAWFESGLLVALQNPIGSYRLKDGVLLNSDRSP
jgi:hypothetical protein